MTRPLPALARHLAVPAAWPLTLALGAWLGRAQARQGRQARQDRARHEPTLTKLPTSCSAPASLHSQQRRGALGAGAGG